MHTSESTYYFSNVITSTCLINYLHTFKSVLLVAVLREAKMQY